MSVLQSCCLAVLQSNDGAAVLQSHDCKVLQSCSRAVLQSNTHAAVQQSNNGAAVHPRGEVKVKAKVEAARWEVEGKGNAKCQSSKSKWNSGMMELWNIGILKQ
jgi:hypothetical protein